MFRNGLVKTKYNNGLRNETMTNILFFYMFYIILFVAEAFQPENIRQRMCTAKVNFTTLQ